tara:strand:- start:246 stop:446 length:201 start_codon:yes stop_codon:yes gene_type:complete
MKPYGLYIKHKHKVAGHGGWCAVCNPCTGKEYRKLDKYGKLESQTWRTSRAKVKRETQKLIREQLS